MRSVWFCYNGEPLEEKSSDLIENKHLDLFKDQLLPNLISNDVCASNERNNNNYYYLKKRNKIILSLFFF